MKKGICYTLLVLILFFPLEISIYGNAINRKPKIAIISLYDENYRPIGKYSDRNKKQYSVKHGYDFIVYHKVLDKTRPPAWSKILALLNHLKDYDWLYWSDADSLIMNMAIKLESLIDNNFNMIISREVDCRNLNTGSFLIKNCIWSEKLLQRVYKQSNFINHRWWEQAALQFVFEQDPSLLAKVKVLHQRALNSHLLFGQAPEGFFKDGDFVLHFYGPSQKELLMKTWIGKVKI